MVLFVVVSLLHFQYIQLASYLFVAALLMRVLHILWAYPFLRRRFIESQRQQSKPLSTRVRTILVIALLGISTSAMHAGEVPKVVVSIVVDQLRTDYLEKFADLYGEGGFKKLLAEGHVYTNGYFSHSTPDRSSATASVYAGCTPYYHGLFILTEFRRLFSVALSLKSPSPGFLRHPVSKTLGLSSLTGSPCPRDRITNSKSKSII